MITRNIALVILSTVVFLAACSPDESEPCDDGGSSSSGSAASTSSGSSASTSSSSSGGYVQPLADCGGGSYVNAPMILNGTMDYVLPGGVLPVGRGLRVPILVSRGARLTEIRARIAPDTHSSIYGATLPSILLSHVGRDGVEYDVHARISDPYAEPGGLAGVDGSDAAKAYGEPHDIVMNLDGIVADDSFYYLNVDGEWGGGQAKDGRICGIIVNQ